MAPDWFLNRLPAMFLDGELWAGRGNFQLLRSIVSKDVPDEEEWRQVIFPVFGAPSIDQVFRNGTIKNTNFHLDMSFGRATTFVANRCREIALDLFLPVHKDTTFEGEIDILFSSLPNDELVYLHRHVILPDGRSEAEKAMNGFLHEVLEEGGEGAVLRDGKAIWTPKRVGALLKLKPFTDDAGIVTGFTSGRETNKGSKLRGLIGALILDYNGKRLELSGLTDEERRFATEDTEAHAWHNPGEDMPTGTEGKHFKVGDKVEFRYRELSDAGIPKEARYLRQV
jgi:DNA ligase-1